MITALLLIAHGSPREESNRDVERVVNRVREHRGYDFVKIAYLDCNDPNIPDGIRECVAVGAERIVCVPYFLHAGRHVSLDIPAIVQQAAREHKHVGFLLSPLIGRSTSITEILKRRASK